MNWRDRDDERGCTDLISLSHLFIFLLGVGLFCLDGALTKTGIS